MDVLEALNWRYAVKKFDPTKKLSVEQIDRIKKALQLTPTSMGLQLILNDKQAFDKYLKKLKRKLLPLHTINRKLKKLLIC